MKRTLKLFLLLIVLSVFPPGSARADIIFPARLEILEIEPGIFQVTFTLPIINGQFLKARPFLPDICGELSGHEKSGTLSLYTETWKVGCTPEQLYGQAIIMEGLIGSQMDVILTIEMLNGRSHIFTFKPTEPVFVIPVPEAIHVLAGRSLVEGIRSVLQHPELFILLLLLVFSGAPRRELLWGLLFFFLAHFTSQTLARQQWLLISPYLAPITTILFALPLAFRLSGHIDENSSRSFPVWPAALLPGIFYGGAGFDAVAADGLSITEQQLVMISENLGVALGMGLIYLLFRELRLGILQLPGTGDETRLKQRAGYIGGIITVGLLIYQASVFLFYPSIFPETAPAFFPVCLVTGLWLSRYSSRISFLHIGMLLLPAVIGISAGLTGLALPFTSFMVLAGLFFMGAVIAFNLEVPAKAAWPAIILTILFTTGETGFYIRENLSFPVANALGVTVIGATVCLFSYRFSQILSGAPAWSGRVIGGGAALTALALRMGEYIDWFNSSVATDYALGVIDLPLPALICLMLAFLFWPRRRRIREQLGVAQRPASHHLILLALAFFILPVGTVGIPNPAFTPEAPRDAQARRILEQALSNTYEAFNLDDEDQLYDQLSQSVSEDLIAEIYLDSRRRLTAGVREGAEVTVREVKVLSVEDDVKGKDPAEGFVYQCKWAVTARVKHLQHIHHRQNIYTGALRIKISDSKWKIDQVALTSEDRIIIPGKAG